MSKGNERPPPSDAGMTPCVTYWMERVYGALGALTPMLLNTERCPQRDVLERQIGKLDRAAQTLQGRLGLRPARLTDGRTDGWKRNGWAAGTAQGVQQDLASLAELFGVLFQVAVQMPSAPSDRRRDLLDEAQEAYEQVLAITETLKPVVDGR